MAIKASKNRLLESLCAIAVACFARSMDERLTSPLQDSFRSLATRLRGIVKKLIQRNVGAVLDSIVAVVGDEADVATKAVDDVATEKQGEAALDLARAVASKANKLGT